MPPLTDEMTASLAALRRYTEAQQLTLAGKRTEALQRYQQAIALDWGSPARGRRWPWRTSQWQHRAGAARRRIRPSVTRTRLPFTDRSFLEASYAYSRGDYDTRSRPTAACSTAIPDNYRALNNLALIYQDRRQFAAAESLFTRARRSTRRSQTSTSASKATSSCRESSPKLAARSTSSRVAFPRTRCSEHRDPVRVGAASMGRGRAACGGAHRGERRGIRCRPGRPVRGDGAHGVGQGRLEESDRFWRTHQRLSAASASMGRHLFGVCSRAGSSCATGDRPRARSRSSTRPSRARRWTACSPATGL